MSATHGPCAGARDVPRTWVVTTDGAARIRAAEQEHCDDFQYAFDQTLAMYARAVQRAARRRSWPSERSLLRGLKRYAQGEDPDSWPSQWERMVNRTRRRDTRLHHKPNISSRDAWTPSRGSRCYVVIRIGSRALPEVGQHPSAELMR